LGTKTRVHNAYNSSKKSKKIKLSLSISSKNSKLPKITLRLINFEFFDDIDNDNLIFLDFFDELYAL